MESEMNFSSLELMPSRSTLLLEVKFDIVLWTVDGDV
jgi:hypothetical protein